jgi:hypothetical protein
VPDRLTRKDIFERCDELAKRFEDYEPRPEDERDVSEFLERRRSESASEPQGQTPETDHPE